MCNYTNCFACLRNKLHHAIAVKILFRAYIYRDADSFLSVVHCQLSSQVILPAIMRIIRELQVLIVLEFLFGFSLVTVKWKNRNLHSPRHSYRVQVLFILLLILLFCFYLNARKSIKMHFSYAEELLIFLRNGSAYLISLVAFIECLLKRQEQMHFWNNLIQIDNIFSKKLEVSLEYMKIVLMGILTLFVNSFVIIMAVFFSAHKFFIYIAYVATINVVSICKSFHVCEYASLILLQTKKMNEAIEVIIDTEDEFFTWQIREKLVIFRRLHYQLFSAGQSICDVSSFSLLMSVVYDFICIMTTSYFTVIAFTDGNNTIYGRTARLLWPPALLSITSLYCKLIIGKKIKDEVYFSLKYFAANSLFISI